MRHSSLKARSGSIPRLFTSFRTSGHVLFGVKYVSTINRTTASAASTTAETTGPALAYQRVHADQCSAPPRNEGKRDGHRDFCLSAGVHENDIAYNRLGFLARRFRDVVEQLRDFSNAQHGLPHNPLGMT